jgi:DNA polymerase III alpha subunit
MIELQDRRILDDGTVVCDLQAAVELLYRGQDLSGVLLEPSPATELYNLANHRLDAGLQDLLAGSDQLYGSMDWYDHWLTPEPYASMDIGGYCMDLCATDEQRDRVAMEMQLFEERHMLPVLRHLLHMVVDLRQRRMVWGVGRGSSVSSYVLFLIGINRIDPLRFGLDVREFLK